MDEIDVVPTVPGAFPPLALSVAAFRARYGDSTRKAYAGDLQRWLQFCASLSVDPLSAHRRHLELFAIYLQRERGNSAKTIHRRLTTLRGFYRVL